MTATVLRPAARQYSGHVTRPERWSCWTPRKGDVLVSTPSKSGTTWTQSILAMLIAGGPDLSEPVPVLSPWVDADLGVPAEKVALDLERQTGRRVVKTHTPGDGFPVWQDVPVIAVYRHPLDIFFSLRKHFANQTTTDADHPMYQSLDRSFATYIEKTCALDDIDHDSLEGFVLHLTRTALNTERSDVTTFHYSDMRADPRSAVSAMAKAGRIDAGDPLVDTVVAATAFDAMRNRAEMFAPVAGTGFWKDDRTFFDSASSRKWEGRLSAAQLARYATRLERLIPDPALRHWIENGGPRPFH
jgi:hypothetical protein